MVGFVNPTNKIVVAGDPVVVEFKDGSSGEILPGDLCYISNTNTIDEGGAATGSVNAAIGIVGYEQANSLYRPVDTSTAYASGAKGIPVILRGKGCIVMARVAAGTGLNDFLTASGTGTGELVRGIIGTNYIYAQALEAKASAGLARVLLF